MHCNREHVMHTVDRPRVNAVAAIIFAASIAVMGTFAPPASAEIVRAVEYYHQAFEHYFVTADPAEIAALDSGVVGGWWRTGQRYRVDTAPAEGLVPVCRFYTSVYAGKASHFFTASAAECAVVKTMPDWTYEGVAFYARVPDAKGNCAAGTAPINRLFNNGLGGAPNHTYTANIAGRRYELERAGWVSEGVAYCTPLALADPMAQTLILDKSTWNLPVPAIFSTSGIVGFPRIETAFHPEPYQNGAAVVPFIKRYFYLPPAVVYHGNSQYEEYDYGGGAGWDPIAGAYIMLLDGPHRPTKWDGIAWTFDNAEDPTAQVCAMATWDNRVSDIPTWPDKIPYVPHPFQQYLLSGCEPGVANRH
jgi:hypothetical protein